MQIFRCRFCLNNHVISFSLFSHPTSLICFSFTCLPSVIFTYLCLLRLKWTMCTHAQTHKYQWTYTHAYSQDHKHKFIKTYIHKYIHVYTEKMCKHMNILTNTQIHHNHTNIHNSMNRHIHLSIQINVPSEAYTKIQSYVY